MFYKILLLVCGLTSHFLNSVSKSTAGVGWGWALRLGRSDLGAGLGLLWEASLRCYSVLCHIRGGLGGSPGPPEKRGTDAGWAVTAVCSLQRQGSPTCTPPAGAGCHHRFQRPPPPRVLGAGAGHTPPWEPARPATAQGPGPVSPGKRVACCCSRGLHSPVPTPAPAPQDCTGRVSNPPPQRGRAPRLGAVFLRTCTPCPRANSQHTLSQRRPASKPKTDLTAKDIKPTHATQGHSLQDSSRLTVPPKLTD